MMSMSRILNADLTEIVDMHLKREERTSFAGYYVSIMKHFYVNDTEALASLLERIKVANMKPDEKATLLALGKARYATCIENCTEETFEDLLGTMPDSGIFRGEFYFVIAQCFEVMGRLREMSDAYLESYKTFKESGVHGKSVKALFNHIAAEHSLHPGKKFLSDFQFLYREAKKHKVHSTAAMALVNISREYQLIGGHELALKYVNRSLALLDRQRYARSFFLALAHRAHVLVCMDRKEEALQDYREAQLCTFPDVRTSLESLKAIFEGKDQPGVKPALMSWEGRVEEFTVSGQKPKLGALEQRLLKFLSEGTRTRWEMIEFLYGDKLDSEVLENRFNNTFQRLKKKVPGLIVSTGGKFSLAEALVEFRYKKNA